jgi:hypothetical protein
MMVLAKKGDDVKLVRFGHRGYSHNYSPEAKANYLKRSAGIRDGSGNLTKDDKFSANYWARKHLWPRNQEADGSARKKQASDSRAAGDNLTQSSVRDRVLRYAAPVGYGVGAGMLAAAAHAGLTNNPANFRPDIYLPAGAATGLLYAKLREQRMQKESAFLPNQLAAPIQRFAGAVKPMVGQVTAPLQQAAQTATQAVKPLVNKAHYQANRASGWMMTNPVAQHFAKSPEDIEQIAQLFKFAGTSEKAPTAQQVARARIALVRASQGGEESVSNAVARAYAEELRKGGYDVDEIDLGGVPYADDWDDEYRKEHQERLRKAHATVYATPVYNWGPSARLSAYVQNTVKSGQDPYRPYGVLGAAGSSRSQGYLHSLQNTLAMEDRGINVGAPLVATEGDVVYRGDRVTGVGKAYRERLAEHAAVLGGLAKQRMASNERVKLSSAQAPANAVEVNGKYYRPKVQTFMYDPRGRILASRSQAAGSGLRAFANYKFPGGGIEPNENVIEAAKKELLEEAGYEPGGEMFEFGKRTPVDWDPTFREQVAKKGRGAYDGQYEYYVAGPLGKRNTSHFGSEGDAMTGLELVRRDKLRKALERTASDPKNEYAYFDKQKLVALAELEKQLLARDIVKARRSAQSGR